MKRTSCSSWYGVQHTFAAAHWVSGLGRGRASERNLGNCSTGTSHLIKDPGLLQTILLTTQFAACLWRRGLQWSSLLRICMIMSIAGCPAHVVAARFRKPVHYGKLSTSPAS